MNSNNKLPKFDHFEQYAVLCRLRQVAQNELEKLGIKTTNPENIINPIQIRNDIIRKEYEMGRNRGIKAVRMYCDLSVKYDLSYDHVMDIVKKKI